MGPWESVSRRAGGPAERGGSGRWTADSCEGDFLRSTAEHVADFWEPFFLKCDANSLLSQLWTWKAGDISANPTYGGDFEAALGTIKARTIIVPVDNDRYFPPVDSKNEARHIPGAKVSVVASAWGHRALMNPADIPAIDAPLNELLAG